MIPSARRRLRLALPLLLAACAPAAPKDRPDILLVVIDTLRADHVGSYGYGRPTTPNLDALAAEGALCAVAYAPMGTTTPAHAALFTSHEPLGLGLVRNGLTLAGGALTLAEIASRNGYRTAAFVSSYPVSHRFGLDQGFDHFDDHFTVATSRVREPLWEGHRVQGGFDRSGAATVDAALAWLEKQAPAGPLFLWVHLFDPHGPHDRPEPYESLFVKPGMTAKQHMIARYDASVRVADEQIGRLVAYFAKSRHWRDTLAIVAADHGEGLLDHGWAFHNRYTYEEEVRVPLVFRWPGHIPAGRRVAQPARLIDVVPTLVSLLGLDTGGASFDGSDLTPQLVGDAPPDLSRAVFLERPYYGPTRPGYDDVGYGFGLRSGRWKYFEAPDEHRRELYDLERDPHERVDLSGRMRRRSRQMSAAIRAWRAHQKGGLAESNLTPEDAEALEALGYGQ